MNKKEYEKAKNMIKILDKKIRNDDLTYYIMENINSFIEKFTTVSINTSSFQGYNNINKNSFILEIYPSINNIERITLEKNEFNDRRCKKMEVEFSNNLVLITAKEFNRVVDSNNPKKVMEHEKKSEKRAYYKNDLIYSKKAVYNMSLNNDNDKYEEEVLYVSKEREAVIRKTKILEDDFLESGCEYSSTKFYDVEKFNNKDTDNHYRVNYFSHSSEEHFEEIKNKVFKLLDDNKNMCQKTFKKI